MIDVLLLIGLTITALGSVMKRDTVKAAIALALSSIILSVLLFRLLSPLAAVFELSVCAGLITVIFMSTISLTKPLTRPEEEEHLHKRARTLSALPVLVIAAGTILATVGIPTNFTLANPAPPADVRIVLWNDRQIDLVGQVLVILAGFFGVLVLFKERLRAKRKTWGMQLQEPVVTHTENAFNGEGISFEEEDETNEPVLR